MVWYQMSLKDFLSSYSIREDVADVVTYRNSRDTAFCE